MRIWAAIVSLLLAGTMESSGQPKIWCNPLNLDYGYCAIPDFVEMGKHRATADPVILRCKDHYFLFSTNQYGYWWSEDLDRWHFVSRRFLKPWHQVHDELCAPAAVALGDTLLLLGSTHTRDFPLWMSTDPAHDRWSEAVDSFQVGAWDPAFFLDDDGRLYLYWGSSNRYPIYGQEINRRTLQPVGERRELLHLEPQLHGWERFGEHADNTFLAPFIEGAWMTKYQGRYYLQYGAPGTEFSGYGDGVYTGSHPLGPFTYQPHNPFSYKPGGFARGAGHGSTFQDKYGNWWHTSTMAIAVKNNFERRLGLWPAGFDADGVLYCQTAYGDYPHYLPDGSAAPLQSRFTGWMLLNYAKPVQVSSTLGGFGANLAVDEDIKTCWSAASGDSGEWLISDLGMVCTVHAVQINYADQDAELMGKQSGIYHRYRLSGSLDGQRWEVLVDKSRNSSDVPHDLAQPATPNRARYLRIENIHVPTGKFALSGFRVFGLGTGQAPGEVEKLLVLRGASEPRNAWLKWRQNSAASGYVVYFGQHPDKLYNSIMVYGAGELVVTALEHDKPAWFQIEAFNEHGIGPRSAVVKADPGE